MAKAKDLIALAGLAGLAYANRDKLFGGKDKSQSSGMTPEQNDDLATANRISKLSDESDALARSNKGMSPGQSAVDDTKAGVLKALTAPKAASNDKASNQGVLGGSTPSPKPKPKRTGMTGAQNTALANAGEKSKAAAENTALAKVNRGMGREVTEAAKANAAPAPTTSSKVKDTTPVTTTPTAKPAPVNKFEHEMPIARFFKNVREAGNRGNPDAKMASGGMTASRRGDGIAQRGKTRGKMC